MNDQTYLSDLERLAASTPADDAVRQAYIERIRAGHVTRDEDPVSHLCVYFAAYDPETTRVFIGHHKKSGLWLFNGGHLDRGERPHEALRREVREEWGSGVAVPNDLVPRLLTLTYIESNPAKRPCQWHFDIWHFVPLRQATFAPDDRLLHEEYTEAGWHSIVEARHLTTDPSTLTALTAIEQLRRP